MSRFSKRSDEPEMMDDTRCSGEVVHQTLREIEFINTWLGGNGVTISGVNFLLKNYSERSVHIADIGCGSGEMLKLISGLLQDKKFNAALTGIDVNPHIIGYAKENCTGYSSIQLIEENILADQFRLRKFDVIIATLFLHHFTSDELVTIFRQLKQQARIGMVVNDLHRHPLAYYAIKLLTKLFSKSAMIKYDAPLSVLRGFNRSELEVILNKAGITNYTLAWRWAFRWQLVIRHMEYPDLRAK